MMQCELVVTMFMLTENIEYVSSIYRPFYKTQGFYSSTLAAQCLIGKGDRHTCTPSLLFVCTSFGVHSVLS